MRDTKSVLVCMKDEFIQLMDDRVKQEKEVYKTKLSRSQLIRDALVFYIHKNPLNKG